MDIKKCASYHRAELKKYKREQQEINKKAYSSVQDIIAVLRNKPNIEKAILFGSLVNGTFRDGSDIDLAIEGIAPCDFFPTWREIEEKAGIDIDLIDLNPKNMPIYNIITRTGKIIYEKPK